MQDNSPCFPLYNFKMMNVQLAVHQQLLGPASQVLNVQAEVVALMETVRQVLGLNSQFITRVK